MLPKSVILVLALLAFKAVFGDNNDGEVEIEIENEGESTTYTGYSGEIAVVTDVTDNVTVFDADVDLKKSMIQRENPQSRQQPSNQQQRKSVVSPQYDRSLSYHGATGGLSSALDMPELGGDEGDGEGKEISAIQARKSMIKAVMTASRQSTFQPSPPRPSTPQSRPSTSTTQHHSRVPSTPQSRASTASDLSGVQLNFCQTAALSLVVNIRLLGVKYPRNASSNERNKMAKYVSDMLTNFPCEAEREMMKEAVNAMPVMYSDRKSFNRWAEVFSKRILKGINSPVAINLGNVLVPNKVYKNSRKTRK